MKKLVVGALTVSTLLLNNVSARETLMDIHLTGLSSTAAEINAQEIGIGYGVSVYTDSGIFLGVSFDFSGGTLDKNQVKIENKTSTKNDDSLYNAGGDLKIGYALFSNKLALYGIGSGINQSICGIDGAGFGYGAGIDYRVIENVSFTVEYKTYSMTSNFGDYDYDRISTGIKYTFK